MKLKECSKGISLKLDLNYNLHENLLVRCLSVNAKSHCTIITNSATNFNQRIIKFKLIIIEQSIIGKEGKKETYYIAL